MSVHASLTAAALMLAAASPALAQTAFQGQETSLSAKASLTGLDLRTPDGARVALAHITRAARDVCEDPADRSMAERTLARRCRQAAIGEAVARLNQPRLSALIHSGSASVQVAGR